MPNAKGKSAVRDESFRVINQSDMDAQGKDGRQGLADCLPWALYKRAMTDGLVFSLQKPWCEYLPFIFISISLLYYIDPSCRSSSFKPIRSHKRFFTHTHTHT